MTAFAIWNSDPTKCDKGGLRSFYDLTSYCSRRADGGRPNLDPKYLNFQKYLHFRISIFGPPQNNTNPVGAAHVLMDYSQPLSL